jgi:hypothetical protein
VETIGLQGNLQLSTRAGIQGASIPTVSATEEITPVDAVVQNADDNVTAVTFSAGVDEPQRGRRARTVIGRALLKNIAHIDMLAQSSILLIEDKIATLKNAVPPNEPEAWEAHHKAIADYETLRRRVEAFVESASGFTGGKVTESAVNKALKSFAKGYSESCLRYAR